MKKLLFSAYSLELGGIEKALVTLINELIKRKYDITLVLEKKQGIFLKELNSEVHIIEYKPDDSSNIIKRKYRNLIKRIKFFIKYKNKFDFSACYATYSIPSSFIARTASKKACLWVHTDYLTLFKGNINNVKEFFFERKYNKFKKIVFVSENAKNNFIKIFPNKENKIEVCNNLVDYKTIRKLAEEEISIKKDEKEILFLNVGRHDEESKKLTRIIEAAKMLDKDNIKFKIIFVGDGPDNNKYRKIVEKERLENRIMFVGAKENPYPYFKLADCVVLSSDYEGYPVVFLESFVLNKPIITTKVSDYEEVEQKYGYIAEKNSKDIYEKMKLFIEKGYQIKEKFDAEKYNEKIIEKLENLF